MIARTGFLLLVIQFLGVSAMAEQPDDSARLWAALASDDPVQGLAAVRSLVASPETTLRLLRQRLRPVQGPTTKDVTQLLADLDSPRFAVRQRAMRELEQLGDPVFPLLRKLLASRPPLEVRRRVEVLLHSAEVPSALSPEQVRAVRAVQVLERIGTAEARKLLETLAAGAPGSRLTEDARAALERLAQ
ncbi:MAG TPA: hypothetical protein VKD72_27025 [Gemmataceae bacterium]|nr:hypothetical protein [Gemmataceae bacterium]